MAAGPVGGHRISPPPAGRSLTTNAVLAVLEQAARDLAALGQRFAVVGGIAVSARTIPRTTNDVDLVVAVAGDDEAERVCANLRARGYDLTLVLEHTATGRLATVRMTSPVDHATLVDLLFASSGIEDLIAADAEGVEVDGINLPIARAGHLLAMKVLSNSDERVHKDAADIRALLRSIIPPEVVRARTAVKLITERGYAREKDLIAELDRLLAASSRA